MSEWKQYRKKPVVIEARLVLQTEQIKTLEGIMQANPGDYIIRGIAGEEYPIKPDIFAATYDQIEETE